MFSGRQLSCRFAILGVVQRAVDSPEATPLCSATIRHSPLKQLVRSAASLPGSKLDVPLWQRLEPSWTALPGTGAGEAARPGELPAEARREIAGLRALVAGCLQRLAARIEETLAPALARALRAWDQVDSLTIVDRGLGFALADAERALTAAARAPHHPGPVRATALEGLLALEIARGLTSLCERRLSSLIRLRLHGEGGDGDLLPGGRPFLDLGAALGEAARAWA